MQFNDLALNVPSSSIVSDYWLDDRHGRMRACGGHETIFDRKLPLWFAGAPHDKYHRAPLLLSSPDYDPVQCSANLHLQAQRVRFLRH